MESKTHYKNHANEITMVHQEIWSNMTILFNPEKTALLKSIDGLNLDPDLKDIKYIVEDNYENYKFLQNGNLFYKN